jgi:hypothetical protein
MSYNDRVAVYFVYQKKRTKDRWELLKDRIAENEDMELTDRLRTDITSYGIGIDSASYPSDGRLDLQIRTAVDDIKDGADSRRFENFIDIIKWIYEMTEPQYVYGVHQVQEGEFGDRLDEPVTTESLSADRITQPTWLMIFPPAMVDTYGRDWLFSLPVDRVEELDDGAVMTISVDDFSDHEIALDIYDSMDEATDQLTDLFDQREV